MTDSPEPRAKLSVDMALCRGHGRCYALCPEFFEPGDDAGRASVMVPLLVGEDAISKARVAQANCPEGAVRVRRERTTTPDE
jgi:ferredoxin